MEKPFALADVAPPGARATGTESYAEAVKTSHGVCLNGVPVNAGKGGTRGQPTVSGVGSFSNSTLHEQDSVPSSWADDDKCFLDSLRVSAEGLAGHKEGAFLRERAPGEGNDGASAGGFRRGRGGRGWRTITAGDANTNTKHRRGNNNGERVQNRSGGNSYGRGNGVEQRNHSGGRFDTLLDVALRRHL